MASGFREAPLTLNVYHASWEFHKMPEMDYWEAAKGIARAQSRLVLAGKPDSVATVEAEFEAQRESGPDVATTEDEGGGVHAIYDVAERADVQAQDAATVLHLVTIGSEGRVTIASDLDKALAGVESAAVAE